ncbi:MAG TPA: hypothetical protein VLB90_06835 [Pseudomonadales bacterium]|nr:hypothetical protein [Pseudomonadales bacterium]
MKIKNINKPALFAAVTLAGAITVPMAHAASNPFSNTELASGFNLEHAADAKAGGEASTGDKTVSEHKGAAEGKCGEGKCGEEGMDNMKDKGDSKEKSNDDGKNEKKN